MEWWSAGTIFQGTSPLKPAWPSILAAHPCTKPTPSSHRVTCKPSLYFFFYILLGGPLQSHGGRSQLLITPVLPEVTVELFKRIWLQVWAGHKFWACWVTIHHLVQGTVWSLETDMSLDASVPVYSWQAQEFDPHLENGPQTTINLTPTQMLLEYCLLIKNWQLLSNHPHDYDSMAHRFPSLGGQPQVEHS